MAGKEKLGKTAEEADSHTGGRRQRPKQQFSHENGYKKNCLAQQCLALSRLQVNHPCCMEHLVFWEQKTTSELGRIASGLAIASIYPHSTNTQIQQRECSAPPPWNWASATRPSRIEQNPELIFISCEPRLGTGTAPDRSPKQPLATGTGESVSHDL